MRLVICIDDTDNLDSRGTGTIAEEIKELIAESGFGSCSFTTRHQLLLHRDIPYTSHNSSMCFECDIRDDAYEAVEKAATEYLRRESAEGSDPGICIAKRIEGLNESALIEFGLKAKRQVLTKEDAYRTAARANVYLQEVGGTGQGIIGALAGVGLRIEGNDGEVKGGVEEFRKGELYTVEQLLSNPAIEAVYDGSFNSLPGDQKVLIVWKAKPVIVDKRPVLLVSWDEEAQVWRSMSKKEMRAFGNESTYKKVCRAFTFDVEEELVSEDERSCLNCRYRRWTDNSFSCAYKG
ncbi:MAG TPA: hypothetical protein PKO38_01880 [Bacillota bacterium]|jgi:hypothetical protein|nr:hypothetical protein [Bacillota bacterium]HQD06111.1 hypothetical protein [Bacillota bacterium]